MAFSKSRNIYVLALLLLPFTSQAQSITISPTSIQLWGSTPATAKVSFEYKNFEIIGLYGFKEMRDQGRPLAPSSGITVGDYGVYKGFYFALFYKPLNYTYKRLKLSGGAGVFNKRFPTKRGQYVAFTVEASYRITDTISVRYSHLSNGFGIVTSLNPGLDNIGIAIDLF